MSEAHTVTRTITATYAVCPHCGAADGTVDHMLHRDTITAWYCDTCGGHYELQFYKDGRCIISKLDDRRITTKVLLCLPPQSKPVYFLVEGMRFDKHSKSSADNEQHDRFFYESHSCPTNWLRPEMIYHDGDADPHGLITYVAAVDSETLASADSTVSRTRPDAHDNALIAFIEQHAVSRH